MPETFRSRPSEIAEAELPKPKELATEDELAEFFLTFQRNNSLASGDEKRDRRSALYMARQALREMEADKREYHFFGIEKDTKTVATARLETYNDESDVRRGYLSMLTVDREYRGRGVAQSLRNACADFAQREKCQYINAHVFTGNPIGLVTELNDGFAVVGLEFQDETESAGGFVISKDIVHEPRYDRKQGPVGPLQEVNLTDLSTIKQLLDSGWVGIDIKNGEDAKNNNPENWQFILEKQIAIQ